MKGNVSLSERTQIHSHGEVFYTSCRSQDIFAINTIVSYSDLHTNQLKLADCIFFLKIQKISLQGAHVYLELI